MSERGDTFLAPSAHPPLSGIKVILAIDWIGQKPDAVCVAPLKGRERLAVNFQVPVVVDRFALALPIAEDQHTIPSRKDRREILSRRYEHGRHLGAPLDPARVYFRRDSCCYLTSELGTKGRPRLARRRRQAWGSVAHPFCDESTSAAPLVGKLVWFQVAPGGLDPLCYDFQRNRSGHSEVRSSQKSVIARGIEIARFPLEAGQILKPDVLGPHRRAHLLPLLAKAAALWSGSSRYEGNPHQKSKICFPNAI